MKKLLFSVMAVAALAFTSCSSKVTDQQAEDEGAAIKAKIENCSDPDSLKIYVQQAKDYADKLVKEGNDSAAQAYLEEVAPAVRAKDPTVATIFDSIEAKADSTVAAASEKADSLKDVAASAVKDAAAAKVDEGKAKVAEAAQNVKDAASDASAAAKQKASDAVQSGADKLKSAIGK